MKIEVSVDKELYYYYESELEKTNFASLWKDSDNLIYGCIIFHNKENIIELKVFKDMPNLDWDDDEEQHHFDDDDIDLLKHL